MSVYALRIVGSPSEAKAGAELIVAATDELLATELLRYAHGRDFTLITTDRDRIATTLKAAGWDMPEIGQLAETQHFLCPPLHGPTGTWPLGY